MPTEKQRQFSLNNADQTCSPEQWAAYLAVTSVDKSQYHIKRIFYDIKGVVGNNDPVKYRVADGSIRSLAVTLLDSQSQKTFKKAIKMLSRIGVKFHPITSRSDFYQKLGKGDYPGGNLVIRVTNANLVAHPSVGAGASVKVSIVTRQSLFSIYTSSLMINSKLPNHLLLPSIIHELAHILGVGHMGGNFNLETPQCTQDSHSGLRKRQRKKLASLMSRNKCIVPFSDKPDETSIMFCALHPNYKDRFNGIPKGDAIVIKKQFDVMTGLQRNKKKKRKKNKKKQRIHTRTHDLIEYCPNPDITPCRLLCVEEPISNRSQNSSLRLFDSTNRDLPLTFSSKAELLPNILLAMVLFKCLFCFGFMFKNYSRKRGMDVSVKGCSSPR